MSSIELEFMRNWPEWLLDVFWTTATIVAACAIGYLLRAVVGARLKRLAARTDSQWDDLVLDVVGRRIGLWSLLLGIYFALPYWPLSARAAQMWVRVLSATGVASVTFALATVITQLVIAYGSRTSTVVTGLTQNVIRIVITTIGALVIVRSFGYDITPMLTVLGVGGLTVALALQEPLSNLFAGLFVSLAGQIHVGHYVKLDSGAEGYVVDLNWRSTRLRQLAGNMIDVPNAKLSQAIVTNFTQPAPDMGMGVDVVVDPDVDLAVVERVALEVAREVISNVTGAVATAEPAVRFQGFVDAGVKFSVGFRVREFTDQFLVRHEMVKALHARFAAEGIPLADPRRIIRPDPPGQPPRA